MRSGWVNRWVGKILIHFIAVVRFSFHVRPQLGILILNFGCHSSVLRAVIGRLDWRLVIAVALLIEILKLPLLFGKLVGLEIRIKLQIIVSRGLVVDNLFV